MKQIGFPPSVSIRQLHQASSSLSTSLKVTMKVNVIRVVQMSEVAFFFFREQRVGDVVRKTIYLLVLERSDKEKQSIKIDRTKTETLFFAEIRLYTSCRSFFDALICCTAVSQVYTVTK